MTNQVTKLDFEGFVDRLTDLSREYGIWIGGCGCCGTPFAGELEEYEIGEYGYTPASSGEFITDLGPIQKRE